MSATASGSQPNGDAPTPKSREHKQGNQERKYTIEQKTAVIRVRKCQATAYYEILALEKAAGDAEIKKAYRKLSLLTHPDKNGYEGADEAFKLVSRAFQVLSDPEKKSRYDQFGGDPDSRFGAGAASASPFSGFARSPGSGMGGGFSDEISPEELFNRFFGGGGGFAGSPFGGGIFDSSPGFVFNLGGGPGIRVHQFGGGRPRRRPASANANGDGSPPSGIAALSQLLPLLLIFVLPLLSSLFSSSSSTSAGPAMHFDTPYPPHHTMQRTTPKLKVNYYIDPRDVAQYTSKNFYNLDARAEVEFVTQLKWDCRAEREHREQIIRDATGLFWNDDDRIREAYAMRLRGCERLEGLGLRVQHHY